MQKEKSLQKLEGFDYLSAQVKRLKNCLSVINNSTAYFVKNANFL